MTGTALVIGATGGFGQAAASALVQGGWKVRALTRQDPVALAARSPRIEWRRGDAMQREDVIRATADVDVVVHAANPPMYRNWPGTVVPMLDNAIAAATASGARLAYPGSLYNYAPDSGALIGEDHPEHPLTRKGRIRVAMEASLREASIRGLRVLVLRCGDFFGPHAPASWLHSVIASSPRRIVTPERPGVTHAWCYLPDAAATLTRLLAHDASLPAFARFGLRGHVLTGRGMAEAVRDHRGGGRIWAFPWAAAGVAAPFSPFMRELREMRYLWTRSLALDNRRLVAAIGGEPHTPLADAVRASLGTGAGTRPNLSPSPNLSLSSGAERAPS